MTILVQQLFMPTGGPSGLMDMLVSGQTFRSDALLSAARVMVAIDTALVADVPARKVFGVHAQALARLADTEKPDDMALHVLVIAAADALATIEKSHGVQYSMAVETARQRLSILADSDVIRAAAEALGVAKADAAALAAHTNGVAIGAETSADMVFARPAGQIPLPAGQILSLDVLLSTQADTERINVALDKLQKKCGMDGADVDKIRRKFLAELHMKGLAPKQWYRGALEIVRSVVGEDKYEEQSSKINQALFVSSRFHFAEAKRPQILDIYNEGEAIPESIVSAPLVCDEHTMGDIASYLNNRLGSTLMGLLRDSEVAIEIFIGSRDDMVSFYNAQEEPMTLRGAIDSPTSTEFYLFRHNGSGRPTVVISGITNKSRFNHQLWQLKYAGVDISRVVTRGTFEKALEPQVDALRRELENLPVSPTVAIVGQRWWSMEILGNLAGINGSKGKAYEALKPTQYQIGPFQFDYIIAEVAGADRQKKSKVGIVALRMPNGSLAGDAMQALVDSGARHVLLAGAGGSLVESAGVGTYQTFKEARYEGATYAVPESSIFVPQLPTDFPIYEAGANVTVDSPFEETRDWLSQSRGGGSRVVDVESAHLLRVIAEAAEGDTAMSVTPGLFISDIVGGDESLTEKISGSDAYQNLAPFLRAWFTQTGISGVYDAAGNLHRFTEADVRINHALLAMAEELPDATRRDIMGVRMEVEDFRVVSTAKRAVDYPDLQSMYGHKRVVYVVPPDAGKEENMREFLASIDPEKVFLLFPSKTSIGTLELARQYSIETIMVVEPNDANYARADYTIARATGWGDYETAVATNTHAIAVFGNPTGYESLLMHMENADRRIFVHEGVRETAPIRQLEDYAVFTRGGDLAEQVTRSLKLRRLEKWIARERPDIEIVRLSDVRTYAEGRKIIGLSGSSRVSQFNPEAAEKALRELLARSDPDKVMFATGGTDFGVEKILHRLIREEYPQFKLIGFIVNWGRGDELGTPAVTLAGYDWFGKSVPFLNSIDMLMTVAGGGVIAQELVLAHRSNLPVFPLAGSGMKTDEYLATHPETPRYYTGADIANGMAVYLGQN